MHDEVLGILKYIEDKKDPEESYWECNRSLIFCIFNDKSGISNEQSNYVIEIEKRLPGLMPVIQEFINLNAENTYKIGEDIEISFIEISNVNTQTALWAIDFEFTDRWEHIVVDMNNWLPIHLSFWA